MARKLPGRTGKLTPVKVRNLTTPGMYGDGRRLWLEIKPGVDRPAKGWIFRYTDGAGKGRYLGLGSANPGTLTYLTLEQARERADEESKKLDAGGDPLADKRAREAARKGNAEEIPTFDQCAERYIAAHESEWTNATHRHQWEQTLRDYASPVFGNLPVNAIDTQSVCRVLEPIWKPKTQTASRLRARIEAVLSMAKVLGWRAGENPAQWRGHLDQVFGKPKKVTRPQNHPSLPYSQIIEFMTALRQRKGTSALALEFAILAGGRTDEVLRAAWSEIDLKEKTWTIPAERMKGRRLHRVPLTEPMLAILEIVSADRRNEFVFPGATGPHLNDTALDNVLRRMKVDVTVHGFRATFRTWTEEQTSTPRAIAEVALAHRVGDATEQSYQRGDLLERRRELMEHWAAYVNGQPDNVVTMPRRGAA
jgi:integrase